MEVIVEFYHEGYLDFGSNGTFVKIIPKVEGTDGIKNSKPINLVGSVYKIILKVLAGRLKNVLHKVISPNQGAFIKGRLILDRVFMTSECIYSVILARNKDVMCKIDMEKAYDRIN